MADMGEVLADYRAISDIVQEGHSIIENSVKGILEDTENTIKELNSISEGYFADMLHTACEWLAKVFKNLIKAFNMIFDLVDQAVRLLQKRDEDGARELQSVTGR